LIRNGSMIVLKCGCTESPQMMSKKPGLSVKPGFCQISLRVVVGANEFFGLGHQAAIADEERHTLV